MRVDALPDRPRPAVRTSQLRRLLRVFASACGAVSASDAAWTLVAATLFTFAHSVSRMHNAAPWVTPAVVAWEWVSIPLWLGFPVAFGLAERPWGRVGAAWTRYAIAAGGAAALQFGLGLALIGRAFGFDELSRNAFDWFGVQAVLAGALAALLHATRARARRAVDAFAIAGLGRALAKRRVVAARLATVQAHADPDFIFDTLTRIDALYGRDTRRAEALLSQLIDFLREALPLLRDGTTTLGREARLVESWLAIAQVRLDDRFDYRVDIPPSLAGQPFHPMLLLPMVAAVLRDTAGEAPGGRIEIRAEALGDRIRLLVVDDSARSGGFSTRELDQLRARLVDLYGGEGRLAIDLATANRCTAMMELPAEESVSAPAGDP